MRVTQWFDKEPPVHVGNYDFKYDFDGYVFNAYWCGYEFIIKEGSVWDGLPVTGSGKWRGAADKPKK